METPRRVTEEDLLVTEAMIAYSYGRLKKSVVQAPCRALRSVGESVRKHPYEAAAVAGGAGLTLYGLFKLMNRPGAVKESGAGRGGKKSRPDMTMEILSTVIPIVAPFIAGYLEKYMMGRSSEDRD